MNTQPPIRLWPGVAAVTIQWIIRFLVPLFIPDTAILGVLGGMAGGLLVLIWWVFFSRTPVWERLGAMLLIFAAGFVTMRVLHPSMATGMMGMLFPIYAVPFLSLALVIGAAIGRGWSPFPRMAALTTLLILTCGGFMVLRTDGITGEGESQLAWRWSQTPEQRLLVKTPVPSTPTPEPVPPPKPEPAATVSPSPVPVPIDTKPLWAGFRGGERDGVVKEMVLQTDWKLTPPVELWRKPIGPGWSSFAVGSDLFYTQEQRGDDEIVSCYRLKDGQQVWIHKDAARFWESNAGAGPRATPTLHNGRLYTLGATGIVNALNALNGSVVWSRNAGEDTKTKVPGWGFSGSPLVVEDRVIVAASGKLIAYDAATGEPRWTGPKSAGSYSSPQRVTIGGVPQIVLITGGGVDSVSPRDGALLWQYAWKGSPILQPALTADGDLIVTTNEMSGGAGLRRLHVVKGSESWNVEERWTSQGLKPYFSDFVIHKNHAYGFDGHILSCIQLEDGKRKWKGGRYGHGQMLLLPAQDLLLVLSEDGEMAFVKALPDQFSEVARMPGINGKTWNHPVLIGQTLLIRNGEEMAAFRLPRVTQ
jgi:outer membrane protein assembly factor BamB